MMPIKKWLKQPEVIQRKNDGIKNMLYLHVNRDPNRAIYYNPEVFYSPADGFILYSNLVEPDEEIIEVKGGKYNVGALLGEEVDCTCLVIGIMMTLIDVHINRLPTNGFVTYQKLPPLKVANLSMRPVEKKILEEMQFNTSDESSNTLLEYVLYNERVKNRVFVPAFNQHYWIVQIADFEVDVICPFGDQNSFYTQGERFSLVRMGSQVDLIVPFISGAFESLVEDKTLWHVQAGKDVLIRREA
jgi:phosphatidylserine decarboxylase